MSGTTGESTKPKSQLEPGARFGRLEVVQRVNHKPGRGRRYLCKCDCGELKEVLAFNLINGEIKSCGCFKSSLLSKTRSPEIEPGTRFGRWTYIEDRGSNSRQSRMCLVTCDCGTSKTVEKRTLLNGTTKSCGCGASAASRSRETRHGGSYKHLYGLWKRLKQRCLNTRSNDFKNWGGRGITLHKPWADDYREFEAYVIAEIGEVPDRNLYSLDRKDNSKGYEPGNVRWATARTQSNNTRRTVLISFNGISLPLSEWSRRLNIPYFTLHSRIKKLGWSVERALTTKK